EKELKVDYPSPEILRITLSGDDPEELKTIVDAVAKAYEFNYLDEEKKDKTNRLERLEGLEKERQTELRKVLNEIRVWGDDGVPGAQEARIQLQIRNTREIALMEQKHSMRKLQLGDLIAEEKFFKEKAPKDVTDGEV